jgi:hypothetical protein
MERRPRTLTSRRSAATRRIWCARTASAPRSTR